MRCSSTPLPRLGTAPIGSSQFSRDFMFTRERKTIPTRWAVTYQLAPPRACGRSLWMRSRTVQTPPRPPERGLSYTGHESHPRTVSAFMSSRSVHARLPSSLATAMQWFAEKASLCVIVVPRVPGSRSVRGPCGRLHVHRHRSWLMWPCRPFSDQESVAGESAC